MKCKHSRSSWHLCILYKTFSFGWLAGWLVRGCFSFVYTKVFNFFQIGIVTKKLKNNLADALLFLFFSFIVYSFIVYSKILFLFNLIYSTSAQLVHVVVVGGGVGLSEGVPIQSGGGLDEGDGQSG